MCSRKKTEFTPLTCFQVGAKAYTPGRGRDLSQEKCTVPNVKWIYWTLVGSEWREAWLTFKTLVYWTDENLKVNWGPYLEE